MNDSPAKKASSAFSTWATPLASALFFAVALTGALLFFDLGGRPLKRVHEWLGLAFALAGLLHLWKNRHAFWALAKKVPLWLSVGLVLAVGLLIYLSVPPSGEQSRERLRSREGWSARQPSL